MAISNGKTLTKLLLLLVIVSLCSATELTARRKKHHHLYRYKLGLLYYMAFLAIKIKIVILIGGAIMGFLFFGKLFALIKYGSHFLETKREPEKVYIEKPFNDYSHNFHHDASDFIKYSDHPPSDRIGGRSTINTNDRVFDWHLIENVLQKFNLTELTFKSLGITRDNCKRRVVCRAKEMARSNFLMEPIFWLLNDREFSKYMTNDTRECEKLYAECIT